MKGDLAIHQLATGAPWIDLYVEAMEVHDYCIDGRLEVHT
jgi:hypothetical protein